MGKVYKFYPVKPVYLASVTVFEIGSAVCGAAPGSNAFIAGRAIAGLGSLGIFAGDMVILFHAVPLRQRPIYPRVLRRDLRSRISHRSTPGGSIYRQNDMEMVLLHQLARGRCVYHRYRPPLEAQRPETGSNGTRPTIQQNSYPAEATPPHANRVYV
jgi:hypothetical protein